MKRSNYVLVATIVPIYLDSKVLWTPGRHCEGPINLGLSICPSVRKFCRNWPISFLEVQHGVRDLCGVLRDRARFFRKNTLEFFRRKGSI